MACGLLTPVSRCAGGTARRRGGLGSAPCLPPVSDLSSKQRAHLRGLAHPLKPVAHVGKEGVTDAAARSLEQALATRELVKVRVLDAAPEGVRETAEALAARMDGAHVVQTVGRTATLYRAHPDHPEIRLPA